MSPAIRRPPPARLKPGSTLQESFANFRDIRGVNLPTTWTLEFSKEIGQSGSVLRFTTQYTYMLPNAEIEAAEFKIH